MNTLLLTVLSLSISASLIALLLLALRPLYRGRLPKTWQYYIWLVVVVRLLLPFAPEGNLMTHLAGRMETRPVATDTAIIPERSNDAFNEAFDGQQGAEEQPASTPLPATQSQSAFSWRELWAQVRDNLWLLWLGVAVMMLVRKVTSYHSFLRFIGAGRTHVDDPELLDAYHRACEDVGVRKPLPLYVNKLAVSPMLAGLFRPVIVLPTADLTPEEFYMMTRHELTHYRRGDILYKWLVQVTLCIHWFNPVVYLMAREIDRCCELSCDETLLRKMDEGGKKQYGNTLLASVAVGGSYGDKVASLTMSEDGKLLKERLASILRTGVKSPLVIAASVVLALGLLCGAAYAGAYQAAIRPQEIPSLPEPQPAYQQPERAELDEPSEMAAPASYGAFGEWLGNKITDEVMARYGTDEFAKEMEQQMLDYFDEEYIQRYESYYRNAFDSDALAEQIEREIENAMDIVKVQDGWNMSGFTHIQSTYFRDDYVFGLLWKNIGTPEDYTATRKVEVNGSTFTVGFMAAAKEYADDARFLAAVEKEIADKISYSTGVRWTEHPFVIYEAFGPYTESADELTVKFYNEDNYSAFLAVFELASADTVTALLERSAAENREDYLMFLVDVIPGGYNIDAIAETAVRNNRPDLMMWLVDYVSPQAMPTLMQIAVDNGYTAIASELSFELADSDRARFAKLAYQNDNIAIFSELADWLEEEDIKDLAEQAYQDDNIAYFSILMDELYSDALGVYLRRAVSDGKTAFAAAIREELE